MPEIKVDLPEGFSPNGDGRNDKFVIVGIENYPNNFLEVYNRWGSRIYTKSGYLNEWDGTSENSMNVGGGALPSGVYFYIINLGDGSKVIKGYIYLNR